MLFAFVPTMHKKPIKPSNAFPTSSISFQSLVLPITKIFGKLCYLVKYIIIS